jgi:Protein of unknown function (DUF3352)
MRVIISAAVAAATAAVIVTASSGGTTRTSVVGGGASVVPADAIAFAAIDTDPSSAQSQAAQALLGKFPNLVARLQQALAKQTKLNWQTDIEPALGSELDVALLPGTKPEVVALTQPADASKLAALVAAAGHGLVTRTVSGWTAIADSTAALDALTNATTTLAQNGTYVAATSSLAGDALVRAYAAPTQAQQLTWASADVIATSGGLKLQTFAQTTAPLPSTATQLQTEIPSGVLAVADFQADTGAALPAAVTKLPQQLQTLLASVRTAIGGETAVYVSAGLPPSVTLITHPADPQAALTVIDQAVASLSAKGGIFSIIHGPLPHATVDGALVVSTSQLGIAGFGSGASLAADPSFTAAMAAAGAPQQTTGFAYVDLKTAIPLVESLASLAGAKLPASLQGSGLASLQSLTAFSAGPSFTVYLALK